MVLLYSDHTVKSIAYRFVAKQLTAVKDLF